MLRLPPLLVVGFLVAATAPATAQTPPNYVAGALVQLNDTGAWSWFMDERVIVHQGRLVVGSVRAVGKFDNSGDPNWGNVEIAAYSLASGKVERTVFHRHFEQDDHDAPAFLVLPDDRLLAVYTKHAVERKVYWRFSAAGDPLTWSDAATLATPGGDRSFAGDNATYSNLFRVSSGRIYDFYRGFSHDPNYLVSDDLGRTWRYGGHWLRGKGGYSPYLKYAFDGKDTIHFVATEDHPRNFDNSLYHGFIRDGQIYFSDGKPAAKLSQSTEAPLATWDLTRVFQGDPDNVAWMCDMELDREAHPRVAFTVQKDGRGLPPRQGGMDHRFHYARWDGRAWQTNEIAHAGTRLYPFEDDYTGLAALDPNRPEVIYIATDADPKSGTPLVSSADGKRHRELFRGVTGDLGKTWRWESITANSTADNIRPLVPKWNDPRTALVRMRGSYLNNHGEWTTAVVATILPTVGQAFQPDRN